MSCYQLLALVPVHPESIAALYGLLKGRFLLYGSMSSHQVPSQNSPVLTGIGYSRIGFMMIVIMYQHVCHLVSLWKFEVTESGEIQYSNEFSCKNLILMFCSVVLSFSLSV